MKMDHFLSAALLYSMISKQYLPLSTVDELPRVLCLYFHSYHASRILEPEDVQLETIKEDSGKGTDGFKWLLSNQTDLFHNFP